MATVTQKVREVDLAKGPREEAERFLIDQGYTVGQARFMVAMARGETKGEDIIVKDGRKVVRTY